MKCKAGDLAILVRAKFAENAGRVVTVLYLMTRYREQLPDGKWMRFKDGESPQDYWVCHCPSLLRQGLHNGESIMVHYACIADSKLTPIRDQDGTDETLREKELES